MSLIIAELTRVQVSLQMDLHPNAHKRRYKQFYSTHTIVNSHHYGKHRVGCVVALASWSEDVAAAI